MLFNRKNGNDKKRMMSTKDFERDWYGQRVVCGT